MIKMLTMSQLGVISYCAQECRRQESGELSVYWMVNAYQYLAEQTFAPRRLPITIQDVENLYAMVEPKKNRNGFRGHQRGRRRQGHPVGKHPSSDGTVARGTK